MAINMLHAAAWNSSSARAVIRLKEITIVTSRQLGYFGYRLRTFTIGGGSYDLSHTKVKPDHRPFRAFERQLGVYVTFLGEE
tara:strand:+ start:61 stop:306 length:246 start_codon:yes stop_codon:yes gene_type:complete